MLFSYRSFIKTYQKKNHPLPKLSKIKKALFIFFSKNDKIQDLEKFENEEILFISPNKIFHFNYLINISAQKEEDFIQIDYKIKYNDILKILPLAWILSLVFFLLFFKPSIKNSLIISTSIVFIFLLFNILYFNSYIRHSIKKAVSHLLPLTENELTDLQKSWQEDPYYCSACGEFLHVFDKICPECGFKQNKKHQYFTDFSVSKKRKIHFFYKKKNKKKKK